MNALFVHNNFPAQYKHIAAALASNQANRVVAIGSPTAQSMPDVELHRYRLTPQDVVQTHPFARRFDLECRRAEQVLYIAATVARSGFKPDVILVHNGWGENLPLKAVFPNARIITYCEYYYRAAGQDVDFDPEFPSLSLDGVAALSAKNANILLSLADADIGIAPTRWQRSTFPKELRPKIKTIHEGIDTEVIRPDPAVTLQLSTGEVLRKGDPILTFVSRNLEPLRGYHVFMRALGAIQKACPDVRVLIIGGDQVSYGQSPPTGESWKSIFLKEVEGSLNLDRIHFLGNVPYTSFQKVLQISSVHVYLTYPFVLSWSLLEAMSTECVIVAADVAPVREFVDEHCGILTDFLDHALLAERVVDVLRNTKAYKPLGVEARNRIVADYDAKKHCLPRALRLITRR